MHSRKTAYLIGIKGVGMTALAQLLKARGFAVSGSDTHEKFFTDAVLKRDGIKVYEGFDAKRITVLAISNQQPATSDQLCIAGHWSPVAGPFPLIVASSAYTDKNPEIAAAKKLTYKVYAYAEALAELFNKKQGIAVCGSHGKTTTSALLGYIFLAAGL